MTSMPASRSARATTLTPRSWPSRPTFASSTRIGALTTVVLALLASRAGPSWREGGRRRKAYGPVSPSTLGADRDRNRHEPAVGRPLPPRTAPRADNFADLTPARRTGEFLGRTGNFDGRQTFGGRLPE